jgi:hypothetical protein
MHRGSAPAKRSPRTAGRVLHNRFGNMHDCAVRVTNMVMPMRVMSVVMPSFGGDGNQSAQQRYECKQALHELHP